MTRRSCRPPDLAVALWTQLQRPTRSLQEAYKAAALQLLQVEVQPSAAPAKQARAAG